MVKNFVLILLIALNSGLFAQRILVEASVDTTDYLIGDRINFSLRITTDKNVFPIRPFFLDSLKNIDILEEIDPVTVETDTNKFFEYKLTLTRFDSAEVTFPSVRVDYRVEGDTTLKSAFSNPLSFNVHRVSVSKEEDIKDIKPPVRIPLNWLELIIWIFVALILILCIIYFYKKYFTKRPLQKISEPVKMKIPPHVEALLNLDKIEAERLWQSGFVKEYHSRITGVIREYFEKRFGMPALEMTTTESLNMLLKYPDASVIIESTEKFLSNADLVKFAKYQPLADVNEAMMNQAREIVNTTIPESVGKQEPDNVN